MRLNNLGLSFTRRFERFGEVKDIDDAIKHKLEAVRLTPLDSPDLSTFLNNLGCSFRLRFEQFGEAEDVDNAIKWHLEAVQLIPQDNPLISSYLTALGNSFHSRFVSTKNHSDMQETILYLRLASKSEHSFPRNRFHASSLLAHIMHDANDLVSAMASYTQAVEILPLLAWIGLSAGAQLNQLTPNSQTLVCDAAACAIETAISHSDCRQQHLGVAIELLDQGRSIMWSQASNIRTDTKDLWSQNLTLAQDLDHSAHVIIQGSFSHPTHQQLTESEGQAYCRAAEEFTRVSLDLKIFFFLPVSPNFGKPLPGAPL
jgi:tetratricopeptide (TPR) repeat protein